MDVDDEVIPDDDQLARVNRFPEKRKANTDQPVQPSMLCTVSACKSHGHDFRTARNYNKHIK